MSVAFTHYAKVRNHYCLAYFGLNHEYITILRTIRSKISFGDLKVFIACNPDALYLLENEPDVLDYETLVKEKTKFAYIREIYTNFQPPHPLQDLCKELQFTPTVLKPISGPKLCLICPDTSSPAGSVMDIRKCRLHAQYFGYDVRIVGSDIHQYYPQPDLRPSGKEKLSLLEQSSWVMAAENEYLYEAAIRGIRTTLVSTTGSSFYRLFVPNGEIMA